jgi:hypothetical protein
MLLYFTINPLLLSSFFIFQGVWNLYFRETKQRMSGMCLPVTGFVSVIGAFEAIRWIVALQTPPMEGMADFMRHYFLAELIYNAIFHYKHTAVLELWIHHIAYIILLSVLLSDGSTGIIRPAIVAEFPTFVRALGTVFPEYRHDGLFRWSFIVTRVIWPFIPAAIVQFNSVYYYIVPVLMQFAHLWWYYKMTMKSEKPIITDP